MKKKAFLVTFGITTRVIADENASDEEIAGLAAERIKGFMHQEGPDAYLNTDNLTDIAEDTECPYDAGEDDKI